MIVYIKKIVKLVMAKQGFFPFLFAYVGLLFAGGGTFLTWVWVTLALVAGRAAGMSLTRAVGTELDARYPGAKERALPEGGLSSKEVWFFSGIACVLLALSSYMLNRLCFQLSLLVIVLLFAYSFFKRFTTASHFYLGVLEAFAPIGGYIAVTGVLFASSRVDYVPFILGAAAMLWIAGLDIIRSLLEIKFEEREGFRSIPAKYGRDKAALISLLLYVGAVAALVWAGIIAKRQQAYWIALAAVAVIFMYQQHLARRDEQEAAAKELYQLNAFVSPVLFVGTFIDVFVKYQ